MLNTPRYFVDRLINIWVWHDARHRLVSLHRSHFSSDGTACASSWVWFLTAGQSRHFLSRTEFRCCGEWTWLIRHGWFLHTRFRTRGWARATWWRVFLCLLCHLHDMIVKRFDEGLNSGRVLITVPSWNSPTLQIEFNDYKKTSTWFILWMHHRAFYAIKPHGLLKSRVLTGENM